MKDNGIYTLNELARIQAHAELVAKQASEMAGMLIYGDANTIKAHSQNLHNAVQARFSDLHSDVVGLLEDEEGGEQAADLGGQSKLNARDLACFEQVASALGEVQAESELQQVIDSGSEVVVGESLGGAFDWSESPQGHGYWYGVITHEQK